MKRHTEAETVSGSAVYGLLLESAIWARIEEFFRLAKTVELRLDPLSPVKIENDKAIVQCRRTMRFADERTQPKPIQDIVTIGLQRSGPQWVIEFVR